MEAAWSAHQAVDVQIPELSSLSNLKTPAADGAILSTHNDRCDDVVGNAVNAVAIRKLKAAVPALYGLLRRKPDLESSIEDAIRACLGLSSGVPIPPMVGDMDRSNGERREPR